MDMKGVLLLTVLLAALYICATIFSLIDTRILRQPILYSCNQALDTGLNKQKHMKTILFWTSYYSDKNWNQFLHGAMEKVIQCDSACLLSVDRRNPLGFDALIFHGTNRQQPPEARRPDQLYIMYTKESPYYKTFIPGGDFYNWTATYNRKSNVFLPMYDIIKHAHQVLPKLPQLTYERQPGEAIILWVVTHCKTKGKREKYVDRLKTYMKVDMYGGCSGKRCPGTRTACKEHYAKTGKYKFYLSFENAACIDYISEKPYEALNVNLVPIVYGGLTAEDHVDLLPPNSFINVRDFTSPKHLADYMLYLDKNTTAYMDYFKWRLNYDLEYTDRWCLTCNALHTQSQNKTSNVDFGKFWNITTQCDNNLVQKVMK